MSKLQHIVKSLVVASAVFCGGAWLVSCSEIDENERLVYVELGASARNVLIEDFTGQLCVNCPSKATEPIHDLQQTYGDTTVVAVAIHSGPFGYKGNAKYLGLLTDTGTEYWNTWFTSSQGQPVVKINRGEASSDFGTWSGMVAEALKQTTDVKINTSMTYDSTSKELEITTNTIATAGKSAKLQVWITEDNIVAIQKDGGETLYDYVHNHVFRTAVNGSWGEDVKYGEDWIAFRHTCKVPEDWKVNDLNAVVFVYDDSGVCQVTTTKVKN